MPPVYDRPVSSKSSESSSSGESDIIVVPERMKPVASISVVPTPGRQEAFMPLESLNRSKFRVPVLQLLADMLPGCGMPLRTMTCLIAEIVSTKQDVKYLGGNLVQMVLGYTDRSKTNRFEPTLLGLEYVAVEEAFVEEGVTEMLYFITPKGRQALAAYESTHPEHSAR